MTGCGEFMCSIQDFPESEEIDIESIRSVRSIGSIRIIRLIKLDHMECP